MWLPVTGDPGSLQQHSILGGRCVRPARRREAASAPAPVHMRSTTGECLNAHVTLRLHMRRAGGHYLPLRGGGVLRGGADRHHLRPRHAGHVEVTKALPHRRPARLRPRPLRQRHLVRLMRRCVRLIQRRMPNPRFLAENGSCLAASDAARVCGGHPYSADPHVTFSTLPRLPEHAVCSGCLPTRPCQKGFARPQSCCRMPNDSWRMPTAGASSASASLPPRVAWRLHIRPRRLWTGASSVSNPRFAAISPANAMTT